MKCCPHSTRYLGFFLAVTVLVGAFALMNQQQSLADDKDIRLLRHVVMFKFKETSSKKHVQEVVDAFCALPSKITEIREFEYGLNNSPEGKNDGLTHCLLLTFHSEKDREVYLPHPAHKAFGKIVGPHVEKVTVFDYWTK